MWVWERYRGWIFIPLKKVLSGRRFKWKYRVNRSDSIVFKKLVREVGSYTIPSNSECRTFAMTTTEPSFRNDPKSIWLISSRKIDFSYGVWRIDDVLPTEFRGTSYLSGWVRSNFSSAGCYIWLFLFIIKSCNILLHYTVLYKNYYLWRFSLSNGFLLTLQSDRHTDSHRHWFLLIQH